MKVVQFTRRPGEGHFSIEGTFKAMREGIRPGIEISVRVCPYASRGFFPRLGNIIAAKEESADVYHILGDVHYLVFGVVPRNTILTIHDCGFAFNSSRIRRVLLKLFWLDIPCRRAAVICAISEKTKSEILRLTNVNPNKIVVIPDCISDSFHHTPREFRKVRPVVLQIGTRPNKNVPRLIAALRGRDYDLHVIGKSTPEIEHSLRENSVNCRFSVQLSQDALVKAYQEADIVSFASTYEGFGMPIAEANAVGRVVVTSNLDPMREVAGDAAVLVDPYSVESIRDGLARVRGDADFRARLVSAGLENVKRFRPPVIGGLYQALYETVAEYKHE
jgi:glycosyltransferase involved in cell wall biosynthesis